jgi:hypothetical protein
VIRPKDKVIGGKNVIDTHYNSHMNIE